MRHFTRTTIFVAASLIMTAGIIDFPVQALAAAADRQPVAAAHAPSAAALPADRVQIASL